MSEGELWHNVEAVRDDGTPTMFRIRELAPKPALSKIFVVELPYPKTELSSLPSVAAYRRLAELEEQWIRPACSTLGWELVGSKTEDGSFFLYMYGATDPSALVAKLSPFDGGLGFYDDEDPDWLEYATLRELLEQARAMVKPAEPPPAPAKTETATKPATKAKPVAKKPATKKPLVKSKSAATTKPAAKKPPPKTKSAAKKPVATKSAAKQSAAKKSVAKKAKATKRR